MCVIGPIAEILPYIHEEHNRKGIVVIVRQNDGTRRNPPSRMRVNLTSAGIRPASAKMRDERLARASE